VGATAESAAERSAGTTPASRLGFRAGQVVQEFGYDDDVVDAAIYWWREDDGDLVDALVDALTNLADGGVIWLFTPKSGRPGHVEPSEIEDAAPTAGLHATSTISACQDWTGTRLATPRGGRR
jgi:Protein of unknown function (DUF3052)